MAARKEVLDFIMLERTKVPPTHDVVQNYALRIVDIYNERKADLLTLQNDLFELVTTCKLYERMGLEHRTPDFELAITMLISTAKDWELLLSETDVQRYENVKLNVIENLADYIRDEYSLNRTCNPLDKLLAEWNQGRPKRTLIKLGKNGFITKKGNKYDWKIDEESEFTKTLYVYFISVASVKFEWREENGRLPWRKFNPIFANMAKTPEEQNVLNDCFQKIKNSVFPRKAREIDDLFDW